MIGTYYGTIFPKNGLTISTKIRLNRLKHQKHWSTPKRSTTKNHHFQREKIDGNFSETSFSFQARLWEANGSREQLLCLKGHQDVATFVTFSPDGQFLDSGPGGARWCSGRRSLRFQGFFGLGTARAGWFLMGNPITMDEFCWLVMVCATKKRLNMATWMGHFGWAGWLKWRRLKRQVVATDSKVSPDLRWSREGAHQIEEKSKDGKTPRYWWTLGWIWLDS